VDAIASDDAVVTADHVHGVARVATEMSLSMRKKRSTPEA
jgi:hypothetical protein